MTDEFDYDLTPDQWEALKALRTPAVQSRQVGHIAVESLISLGLAMIGDGRPALTAQGRRVLIRGSSRLLLDLAA